MKVHMYHSHKKLWLQMQGLGALIRTEKNIRLFSMERVNKVEVIESN